ncbi:hypothetical protein M8J77_002102 [Diaphorina citri]|nr:hypothetical protein M8J77_002102 [Diaphorina citri]
MSKDISTNVIYGNSKSSVRRASTRKLFVAKTKCQLKSNQSRADRETDEKHRPRLRKFEPSTSRLRVG